MTKINKFPWNKYKYFGHNFTPIYKSSVDNGWHECSNCSIKVYTDTCSHFADKLMYWAGNLFHYGDVRKIDGVVEFNITCNDVIIKKIIE
jgi:hypothetical protein